ncbi:hypothetical protein AS19_10960 [Alcanivorax sp. NBRC 101098]|nr:hypothetical protein AS19_10960 [Alcanivorax sp. NBRC 101098]
MLTEMALSVWVQATKSGIIAMLAVLPAVVEYGARIIAPKGHIIYPD